MEMSRLLDAIALLLLLAPVPNAYFLALGSRRYRRDVGRSPILLTLLVVMTVVWLIGAFTAVLAGVYLSLPATTPTTPTGVFFGFGLLLLQSLPHFIEGQMRRVEERADHGP